MARWFFVEGVRTINYFFFWIPLLGWLLLPLSGEAASDLGAASGERLKFNIHWLGVPAGSAFMDVRPSLSGQYSLVAGVESIGVVRMLHPLRDQLRAEGFRTASGYSSRYFSKQQQRGDNTKLIEYRFDREWGEAVRTTAGEEIQFIGGVFPGINDLVSGFYTLRACPGMKPGARLYIPMVDGRKVYEVEATVGNPERLTTPLGIFDVLPLTVVVGNSDLFRLQGAVVTWLTNDDRRMPVKVESRIDFKRVAADLVFYDDGRGEKRELKESN